MKRSPILHTLPLVLALVAVLSACVQADNLPDSPQGNIEALWRIMDEHYCFFDYKKEQLGVDWDEVHARYAAMIDRDDLTDAQQFEVMARMLGELRDGHVNLYTAFDTGREWSWQENYPANVSDTLIRRYLGTDYLMANGMQYRILDDNIGYLRCPSFSHDLGAGNLDYVLSYLLTCDALIIDLRGNGGGMLTSAEELAARFINEPTLVGYIQHKTGPGHADFSPKKEQWLKPGKGIRWQKPVCVLTNRAVYSAANEFVKYMRCAPLCTIVGDQTGGGAGLPFSDELPNGWGVRFSACPMYDRDDHITEHGIAPDVQVSLTAADALRGIDTLIETARALLRQSL